jgi:ketosteroid isomerase-like protein
MKKTILCLLSVIVLFSCTEKKPIADPNVLIDADIAFSDYSIRNGIQKAFIAFADDSVVLLKPKQLPIVGKSELIKSYEGKPDSAMQLSWKPVRAFIAQSGDLGYTYGLWTFVAQSDSSRGTYLTIWKKNADGKWKYVADTGNEGLGK